MRDWILRISLVHCRLVFRFHAGSLWFANLLLKLLRNLRTPPTSRRRDAKFQKPKYYRYTEPSAPTYTKSHNTHPSPSAVWGLTLNPERLTLNDTWSFRVARLTGADDTAQSPGRHGCALVSGSKVFEGYGFRCGV